MSGRSWLTLKSYLSSAPTYLFKSLGIFILPISSWDTLCVQLSAINILEFLFNELIFLAPLTKDFKFPLWLAKRIENPVNFIFSGTISLAFLKAC